MPRLAAVLRRAGWGSLGCGASARGGPAAGLGAPPEPALSKRKVGRALAATPQTVCSCAVLRAVFCCRCCLRPSGVWGKNWNNWVRLEAPVCVGTSAASNNTSDRPGCIGTLGMAQERSWGVWHGCWSAGESAKSYLFPPVASTRVLSERQSCFALCTLWTKGTHWFCSWAVQGPWTLSAGVVAMCVCLGQRGRDTRLCLLAPSPALGLAYQMATISLCLHTGTNFFSLPVSRQIHLAGDGVLLQVCQK